MEAREILERRLPGSRIRHLAYPWLLGGSLADRLAAAEGTRSLFYGPSIPSTDRPGPLRVRRLPGSFLKRLPGRGRASLSEFLRERFDRGGRPWGTYP